MATVAADLDIRCAVLTGAGDRVFCAGMDMKTTIPLSQRFARGERIDEQSMEGLRNVATALLAGFDLGTPLVAAVNGRVRVVIAPMGQSRPDWEVICDLASRIERKLGMTGSAYWGFESPAEVLPSPQAISAP